MANVLALLFFGSGSSLRLWSAAWMVYRKGSVDLYASLLFLARFSHDAINTAHLLPPGLAVHL
jgi:hypothetical protein